MKNQKYLSTSLIALAVLFSAAPMAAWAATAPSLGTASTFGALGGAGVTCTTPIPALPAITVAGDVGTPLPGVMSVTGFPGYTPGANPCSLSGSIHVADAIAIQAQSDLVTAYNTLASNLPANGNVCPSADATHNLVGNLGAMTLAPGVYCISGVGLLTGQLTLDLTANGGGDRSGVWVFKGDTSITPIGGATPALRSSVVMANGGSACNVYWQLGTAATFVNTDFVGTILAGSAITFSGSTLAGRALANVESVTMTGSSISSCGATQPPPPPFCDGDHDGHDGEHDGDHDNNGHHDHDGHHNNNCHHEHEKCNQGVGNGPEGCDPGNSNLHNPFGSNDENGGTPGNPGRKGGNN